MPKPSKAIADGGKEVAEGLAQLGAAMADAAGGVVRFAAGFDPEVFEGLSRAADDLKSAIGGGLAPAIALAAKAAQAFDETLAPIKAAVSEAGSAVRSFASAVASSPVGQAAGGVAKVVGGAAHVAGGIASAVGSAGAAVGGAAAAALEGVANVAGAVTESFTKIVGVASGFVEALNPAIMLPLSQAFQDLSATVGVALTPVISGATEVLRSLGSVLLPVMEALQPAVAQLTQVFLDLMPAYSEMIGKTLEALMPLVQVVLDVAKALSPFVEIVMSLANTFVALLKPNLAMFVALIEVLLVPIKMLSDLLLALTPILEVVSAVASGVASALKAVFDGWLGGMGGIKDTFAGAQDAVREFSKQLILAIAALAKMAGYDNFLKGFIDSFDKAKRQDNSGLAAITGTKTNDFAGFSKEIALASAKAGAGGEGVEAKQTNDWLKDTVEELKRIQTADKENANALAAEIIKGVTKAMRDQFPDAAKAYDTTKGAASGAAAAAGPGFGFGIF